MANFSLFFLQKDLLGNFVYIKRNTGGCGWFKHDAGESGWKFSMQVKVPKCGCHPPNAAYLTYMENQLDEFQPQLHYRKQIAEIEKRPSEAVVQRCSVEKLFLEISQNSQENIYASVSFWKRLWHMCVVVNFVKFLRRPFFIEHLWCLLLDCLIKSNTQEQNVWGLLASLQTSTETNSRTILSEYFKQLAWKSISFHAIHQLKNKKVVTAKLVNQQDAMRGKKKLPDLEEGSKNRLRTQKMYVNLCALRTGSCWENGLRY